MGTDQKPRPLGKLYNHASELLDKARRDRDKLRAAADAGDDERLRDEVFDFSVTVYHVRNWVEKLHPDLEPQVNSLFKNDPALKACRDICNSSKHWELNYLPSVKELDYSAVPPVSAELTANRRLKVVLIVDGQRIRVEALADKAIGVLEGFFKDHALLQGSRA